MKLPCVIILITFFFSSGLSAPSLSSSSEAEGIVRNSSPTSGNRKCHINVCFAIDGSGSINDSEFALETGLALDVISTITTFRDRFSIGFGAVQYGNRSFEISRVSEDTHTVAKAVDEARPKSGLSSIAAGIDGCSYLLAHSKAGLPVIVLMGDGRNNSGYDPVQAANMFRRQHRNGEIYLVAVGATDVSALKAISAAENIFTADQYFHITDVILNSASVACPLD